MHSDETIVAQRWVIVVLTLLILFVGFLWLNARADANAIKSEGVTSVDVNNLRTELSARCNQTGTTTAARRESCEALLRDLSAVLMQYANEFRSAINTPTSTSEFNGGTTSTPVTSTPASTTY